MLERGSVIEVEDQMGRHKVVNTPFRFRNADAGVTAGAPSLGADGDEVLRGWLEAGDDELSALRDAGII
jgi:crotonobetainyl-CoA:carnitine CoA-transferase CaiB-like acyl-CoA transferase